MKGCYRILLFLFLLLTGLTSCDKISMYGDRDNGKNLVDTITLLERIQQRGKLVAVTEYNAINYYIFNGRPMGFQYDMLKDFCQSIGVKLELKVERNERACLELLDDGEADLVAVGVTITNERKRQYLLSDPLLTKHIVLVQQMPPHWENISTKDQIEKHLLRSTLELAGKTVTVVKGSHFETRLLNLIQEIGDTIYVNTVDSVNVQTLIEMVSNKEIDYTLADEHFAYILSKMYPNIDATMQVSFEQNIGWAMDKGSDSTLYLAVNRWIDRFNSDAISHRVFNRYFKTNSKVFVYNDSRHAMVSGNISIFDDIIKDKAAMIGWDWKLLASLIYQESKFNPEVSSFQGAYGLMQLMPSVMKKYGIDSSSSVEDHIHAGARLLQSINNKLPESIVDSLERVKFVLASYNAGMGHILDARRLASKYGKDPNVWSDNVDFFMLNKSKPLYYNDSLCYNGYARGVETYNFVSEILDRYHHYQTLVPE